MAFPAAKNAPKAVSNTYGNKEGLKKVWGSGSPPSDMAILMISPSSPFS